MKRGILIAVCTCLAFAGFTAQASAIFGLNNFNFVVEDKDGNPIPNPQAGSHPFAVTTSFGLNYTGMGNNAKPDGEARDIAVELPAGFAGSPTATPTCPRAVFLRLDRETGFPSCPDSTAVGILRAEVFAPHEGNEGVPAPRAVFNLAHAKGTAAQLGFLVAEAPVILDFEVNPDAPNNVIATTRYTSRTAKLFGAEITIWGVPANPAHDDERGKCAEILLTGCTAEGVPEKPFITLPRSCQGPLLTTYSALSWQGVEESGAAATPFETSGCDELGFDPEIGSQPTVNSAETPSGLSFELRVDDPELTNPSESAKADSDIEKLVVTLPEGVTTNPSVASGLGACTRAQFDSETIDSAPGTGCPENSRIGTLEVESPLIEGEIFPGSIYVAKQGDNPFNNLLSIYMVVKDPNRGVLVGIPGRVDPNPSTGQLTTTFDQLPQLPLSRVRAHFQQGPRGALITPPTCGTFATDALLYPYAGGPPKQEVATFEISSGANGAPCASSVSQLPHAPSLAAGSVSSKARAFTPFTFNLRRNDGSQQLSQISATLPSGLLGKLAGIPYCSEAGIAQANSRSAEGMGALELASPSCPAASRVGTATVASGAGPEPYYVQGSAYLAGPYKGGPLSLVIITPAIAGPFDLGVVAVRTALKVDPATLLITAQSDPLPTILHGLPLVVRSVSLDMERPNFMLNPSNCEPKSLTGTVTSTTGAVSPLSQYFQASQCGELKFKPALKLTLKGSTKRTGNPSVKAVLTQPEGQAGFKGITAVLPRSAFIDNAHINNPCTRAQFEAGACPANSILGKMTVWSPLLDQPLSGPVYFRSNGGVRNLPDIVGVVDGQIRAELIGFIDSVKKKGADTSRVRTRFLNTPDAPVSKAVLEMAGGKRG